MEATSSQTPASEAIFPKLSSGPSSLSPDRIASHQSGRLKGAMVEAVSRHGYAGTTLNELVTLAGVSKTTFYKHFASKQDCFLQTFDEIVAVVEQRVGEAYRDGGDIRERLERSLSVFMQTAVAEPAAATLATVEILALGAPGVEHSERASRTFEALIRQSYVHSSAETEVPPLIVRAVVGGIKGVTYRHLRTGNTRGLPSVCSKLVDWTLSYQRPPGPFAERAIAASREPQLGEPAERTEDEPPGWEEPPDSALSRRTMSQRDRIVRAAARVAVERGYATLSIPTITSAAGVSNQTFYEHFESKRDAFLAAFETYGVEALQTVAFVYARAGDGPEAIGAAIRAMLEFTARNELPARLSTLELPAAAPIALDRLDATLDGFASFLRPGLVPTGSDLVAPPTYLEAIPSGGYALIQQEIVNGRIASLPVLAPALTALVTVPLEKQA